MSEVTANEPPVNKSRKRDNPKLVGGRETTGGGAGWQTVREINSQNQLYQEPLENATSVHRPRPIQAFGNGPSSIDSADAWRCTTAGRQIRDETEWSVQAMKQHTRPSQQLQP